MNLTSSLVLLGVTALPFAAPCLDDLAGKPQDAAAWVKQLGSDDYKARKEAFDSLQAMGESARGALERAAKSDDAEIRFNATVLLDRLADEARAREQSARNRPGWLRESDLPPQESEPRQDGEPRRPGSVWRGGRFRPLDEQGLRDLQEELQKRFDEVFGGRFQPLPFQGFDLFRGIEATDGELALGPGSSFTRTTERDGQRERLSIKVDAEGRATAELERDGRTERYEADSLEALRKAQPQLFEDLGVNVVRAAPGKRVVAPPGARLRVERPDAPQRPPQEPAPPAADRPRLGVQVEAVHPAVAAYLELDEGVGLHVVEVVEGSAAQELGVRRNDIVLEVNGRTLRSVEDVTAALAARRTPTDADVTVLRKGVRVEL